MTGKANNKKKRKMLIFYPRPFSKITKTQKKNLLPSPIAKTSSRIAPYAGIGKEWIQEKTPGGGGWLENIKRFFEKPRTHQSSPPPSGAPSFFFSPYLLLSFWSNLI